MSVLNDVIARTSWDVRQFGRLTHRSKEAGRPDLEPLSVFLDTGVVPRAERADNYNQLGADMSNYLVVRPGDIVFNKLRTWQGGLGVSRHTGVVSPAYFVCRPDQAIDPRYYHYLLRSNVYLAELTRLSKFMPPSQFDIAWDDLRTLPVLRPPLAVQRAISDYLDVETTRIDALIAKKQQLIHLLEERIDAEIMEVVGRSEIAVAGGARSVELRRVLEKLDRAPVTEQLITAFRDGQVTTRSERGKDGFTNSWTDNARVQGVRVGDVVVHGLDGFSGAIGDSEADGVCSPVYHVCRPRGGGDPAFYGRLLRRLALAGYLGNFAVSTRERAVDFRNWDLFGRIPIPLISRTRQREIGDRIRKLRPLVALVEQSETLAAERRSVLISRVVVGDAELPIVT